MYKIIEPSPKEIILSDGTIAKPIITLSQIRGNNKFQIINKDNCWVLCFQNRETERYEPTPYIFYEAQEAIKTLDRPDNKDLYEIYKQRWENDPEKKNYDIWPELFDSKSSYLGRFR